MRAGEARVGPHILVVVLLRPPALGPGSLRRAWASVGSARVLALACCSTRPACALTAADRRESDFPPEYPEVTRPVRAWETLRRAPPSS